jgi:hypothetical protein
MDDLGSSRNWPVTPPGRGRWRRGYLGASTLAKLKGASDLFEDDENAADEA